MRPAWLAERLPRYAAGWQPDRASLRPEEEATRKLRLTARNDLLHFDAFPSRPSRGHRILRLYVNINPTDDRVWMTSDTFAKVLEKYGAHVGLPAQTPTPGCTALGQGLLGLFQPNALERTEYDEFMLRLHHFLKTNDEFQERARALWHFKPGTAWLLFSDAISHAELRGQYALEHSFFVAPADAGVARRIPADTAGTDVRRPRLAIGSVIGDNFPSCPRHGRVWRPFAVRCWAALRN